MVSLYSGVHHGPNQLAGFHLDVDRKGIGAANGEEERRRGPTEVRREEEQKERWSVFLMESDSQGGGRDNNTARAVRCAHSPIAHSHTHVAIVSPEPCSLPFRPLEL